MAVTSYNNNGERYERYNFNATEDDYIVCDILINLEALIQNSNPEAEPPISNGSSSSSSYEPTWSIKARNLSEPLWHNKKKRSALESPPSPPPPPRIKVKNEGNKFESRITGDDVKTIKQDNMVYSPSSPLSYEPNDDNINNNDIRSNHHFKHKSKKRKVEDWEYQIRELEQTKKQLKLSLDNVRRYHQTLLELNTKFKAKRDEKNGELRRRKNVVNGGFGLNLQTGPRGLHQFPPVIGGTRQQKEEEEEEEEYHQKGTFNCYPLPFLQANAKLVQAAEARHRRKIKINSKKNSISLRIRTSS
ncbi:uncharacterized protein LOC141697635 [Apium graveolens]|uniref:uncharacterized protein LOC141697635 n=1 Tax=Apium graveolens TaxID=4045 RepID=UPI003D78DC84